jgi:hypothetical protein
MIPITSDTLVPPAGGGNLLFHIIVDDFSRTYTVDGPGGPNGVRLHFEMLRASRALKRKFRDFDLRVDSQEAVLAEMQKYFPGYNLLGTWASSQAK